MSATAKQVEQAASETAAVAHSAEVVELASLKPHPRNYRVHSDEQVAHIVESIREHGFYRNVVVAKDNTILAGHGAALAAARMGFTEIPVVRLDLLPGDPRALKVLTGDNEIGRLAEVDDRMLTELLKEINTIDADGLLGTGFDEQMLSALVMVTRPASEIGTFDAAAEWVGAGMPDFDPGDDLFRLIMQFRSEADRQAFADKYGITVMAKKAASHNGAAGGKTWSAWWPHREKEDTSALAWTEDNVVEEEDEEDEETDA